ncbi:MAG TPA: hypothetical protein VJ695_04220 [Nitrososphaera sp.]|nr:hypothetical protein [Nitrososphaera sp.]
MKSNVASLDLIVDSVSFFKFTFLVSERHMAIIVFIICIAVRAVPELAAYPNPIGYDVVNYYIPIVENFHEHWNTISMEFPLYVTILYALRTAMGIPTASVVIIAAVGIAGLFGLSLFYIGRTLLRLQIIQSMFLAIFPFFQMAVLRTFWDLHRDVLAMAAMLLVFSFLDRKEMGRKAIPIILALSAFTVAADRMIGALFCVTLAIYLIITKSRNAALSATVAITLFSVLMIASNQPNYQKTDTATVAQGTSNIKIPNFYTPVNLLIFFMVVNVLVAAPAIIGFLKMRASLLKIPLLISLAGSFSWLLFPENNFLVADRWIIITGVFLSIFAAYGILRFVSVLKANFAKIVSCSILGLFAVIGLSYALSPHDNPFILYGAAQDYITYFAPVTMQFNSLDVQDGNNLLRAIRYINENTEANAIIVGEPHWRGFMELYLEEGRIYHFSNDPVSFASSLEQQGYHVYLIRAEGDVQTSFKLDVVDRN